MFQRICIKIRSSLTTKFFVTFLFLLIVPLIILTQIFAVKLQSVLQKKELSSTREKISYAQEQFDQLFSDMDRIATSLILDWHVIRILSNSAKVPTYEWFQDYKSLNSILELLNSTSDYKYNITVVGYDDRIYHSTASYNSMLHTDFALIQRIMTGNGNPIIFNRALEGYDDVSMITLGRSVYQKGSYLGTILVEVPVSYLDNLLLPFENDSGILYVLEDSQRILYSSRSDDSLLISENLSTALRQKLSSVSINHTDFLLTQMPSSQHGLSIATLITKDSVFRESSEVIQLFILAFFLVIAATVFGIIFLTHTFTRNILSLNQAVSRFGKNADFYINLPIHSADEIGQLTSGVIDMSHRIKTLLEEIQKEEEEKRILEFNSLQSQINPHMIYNTLNMKDSLWALILPGAISTWNLIVMRTNFQQIPDSLEESAKIDGANDIVILFKIILPLSKPILAVMLLFYGVAYWNAWFDAMLFIRTRTKFPIQLIMREILITNSTDSTQTFSESHSGIAESIKYATIIITTIPILVVYPFIQKYFVKGVMIGAIKG